MNPQSTNPARNPRHQPRLVTQPTNLQSRNPPPRPRQQTLWGFIQQQFRPAPIPEPAEDQPPAPTPNSQPQHIVMIPTPPSTPIIPIPDLTQQTNNTQHTSTPTLHQRPLHHDRSNNPWGDWWALRQPTNLFRILSKNTGTLNLRNLDIVAITTELINLNASVFAAQETNVHWDTATSSSLRTQCRQVTSQARFATSTSAEKAQDWFKPGGTLTLAMNKWTGRIIDSASDPVLGRWSYLEFIGKQNKRIIVLSGYRVCPQPFDAASQTVTAQQTRLLQAQGLQSPNPRALFLTDLITLVHQWRTAQKEVILCIDMNDPVDDPKADVARLFQETDLLDLHYHKYPSYQKPATHQRGSRAIDLIAGSPNVADAVLHVWICPFGDPATIKGDHRLLGVDLDPDLLFGNSVPIPAQLTIRGVHSRHDLKVTKFCKRVVTQCNRHHLAERISHLQTLTTLGPEHITELESIDEELTAILLAADRQCQPRNADPWSPALNQAYLRHCLWTIALSAHNNNRNMSDVINAIRSKLQPSPEDEAELHRSISANLRHVQKQLQKAKRDADQLRKAHLEAVLNEAKAAQNKKKTSAVKYLIRAEQNRRCYAAFRQHTKPKSAGGLAYLLETNPATQQTTTILDQEEMEKTLLDYSRTHFAAAQGSPFTIAPLSNLLQYDGLTNFGDKILKGRAHLEHLPFDEPTRALLTHLRDKSNDDSRKHPFVYEELQEGIKKWPENTTTSPSGRHLGIYKTLQRHVITPAPNAPPSTDPINQGRDVLYLIFDIMSLALTHTYTLNRWKTVWTFFIEKDLGNPDINRLRCLMIFEADWQLLLKWHAAKGFLPKSEAAHTLTPVQGGGRKGRSAIDQATQQVVETEIIHLNQRPAIDLFLDLRHCFDYMVEACHNMACRRHGAADDYLRLHAQTHRLMRYYVRHKYGVSHDYNTSDQSPWHGAGQGAADAALRYIVLSDTLIDAYHSRFQPWTMQDPTLTMTIFKSIKAFIDDVEMSAGHLPLHALVQRVQDQLQWWHQLVRASGGALNPTKCVGALYYWQPDKDGILRTSDTPEPTTISVSPDAASPIIPMLRLNEGTRYLGIYLTRTGNTKPMEDHIWHKAVLYTRAFQRTHMNRREANVLYRSCFLPAITYSFPATWLPSKFLERIHTLSTSTILNKMGFHRNLPRSLVFAPRDCGGVGLCNLISEHGAQQLLILIRHMRTQTQLGIAIKVLLRTYQLWAGLRQPILVDTQPCPWLPDHWLSSLRAHMHDLQIHIRYPAWTIPPMRMNDRYLMQDFAEQDFPTHKLLKLNACRMYLQVTTLAEITDHTGKELLPQILLQRSASSPKGLINISSSKLHWPQVNPPSTTCWRIWTATICSLYTGTRSGTRLQTPLGDWTTQYDRHRFWHWRQYSPTQLVYQHTSDSPTRIALRTQHRRTMDKYSPSVPTQLQFQGPPVTPLDPTTGYVRLPILPLPALPLPNPTPLSFATIQSQFRATLEPWQHALFGSIHKAGSRNALIAILRQSQPVMIISDASVQKNKQSGFAWIIARQHTILWRGAGLAPGPAEDIYSGRAEAFGILAAITFLSYYVQCYADPHPSATVNCFCDNAGVITNLSALHSMTHLRPNDATNDDRDIYLEIIATTKQVPRLTFQYFHVKGHQDKDPKHQLTLSEKYNVDCDNLAKQFVRDSPQCSTSMSNPEFAAASPHLIIAGKVICRRYLPALQAAASKPPYWSYLRKRLHWTQADIQLVHWETLASALHSFPSQDQRRIILLIHDKLPLRSSKFHPHLGSALCPSCQRQPETSYHFLECNHPDRSKLFTLLHRQLSTLSVKNRLHPGILTAFWLGLTTVRANTPYPPVEHELPPALRYAIRDQTRLGWTQLYYGRFTQKWAAAIDTLNPELALPGSQVMTQFLQTVWKYFLATWTARNQHFHQDAGRLSLPDYQQAIRTLYERRSTLSPDVQEAVFRHPLDYMLQQPPHTQRTWLERSTKYMTQQLKAEKLRARLNTPDIRSFFGLNPQSANDLHPP